MMPDAGGLRACFAALIVVGGLSGGAEAQSNDALYEQAKKEGTVVWYVTFPLDEATPLAEAFEKRFPGVNVELVRGSGTRIIERFETEYRAGRQGADVLQGALLDPFLQWKKDGWLLEYRPPEGEAIPAEYKDEGYWYLEGITMSCILYGTQRVKASEAPSSIEALLDAKWKGRVGSIPAWATGTALEWAFYVEEVLGHKDYAKGLRELDPPMESAQAKLVQNVIRGEIDVALPIADYNLYRFQKKGAPVDCTYPKADQGVPANVRPVGIPKNVAHPNAAKLFLNWRLSEEGQKAMQDGFGMRSVREGMSPPKGLPPQSELKVYIPDPSQVRAKRDEIIKRWRAAFGQ